MSDEENEGECQDLGISKKELESYLLLSVMNRSDNLRFASETIRSNEYVALTALSSDEGHNSLEYLSESLKKNKKVVHSFVSIEGSSLFHAHPDMRKDIDIVLAACASGFYPEELFLQLISEEMRSNKEVALAYASNCDLKFLNNRFHNDKDVVMTFLNSKFVGMKTLEHVGENLRKDREVLFTALCNGSGLSDFKYATSELRNDRELFVSVIDFLKQKKYRGGYSLEHAGDRIKNDKEIVTEMVQFSSTNLKHASKRLQNDREIVLAALSKVERYTNREMGISDEFLLDRQFMLQCVKKNGAVFNLIPYKFMDDQDFVIAAIPSNGSALRNGSSEIKRNKEMVIKAVSDDGMALEFASEELKKDRDVVIAALSNNFDSYKFADKKLCMDRDVIMESVAKKIFSDKYYSLNKGPFESYVWLSEMSEEILCDKEVVMAVLSKFPGEFEKISKVLKHDIEVVLAAMESVTGYMDYRHIAEEFKNDKELLLKAIKRKYGGSDISLFAAKFRDDKEVAFEAVKSNDSALEFLSPRLKNDKEIVLEAVKKDGLSIVYASYEMKCDEEVGRVAMEQNKNARFFIPRS